ncbi:MAG: ABC transporter ATP-binding protein [Sphaerochaetaceae bacterium]
MNDKTKEPLLQVKELQTYFFTDDGVVKAVDGVSFDVYAGEILGLVGESGCGKSVTSFSILRLVDEPGEVVGGEVYFEGKEMVQLTAKEMAEMRGNKISMVFQQPQSSLNPVFTVGSQVAEVLLTHNRKMKRKEAWEEAVNLLRIVGIPDPERKAKAYPHQMSGGQAQRVMIAMALALKPKLLIADEPTTALDVTIQAQILDLMLGLRDRFDTAVILITHDLGVISEMADRIAVMYAGHIVEKADVEQIMEEPLHPYTRGLIDAVPVLGKKQDRLAVIPGSVPNLIELPMGCRFEPRCTVCAEKGMTICKLKQPDLIELDNGRQVRC